MTRLQNAEKQLSDALAALESAVESSIEASASSAIAATPSKADFAALIDEVSGIEAKLGEAMQVIADIDVAQTSARVMDEDDFGGVNPHRPQPFGA